MSVGKKLNLMVLQTDNVHKKIIIYLLEYILLVIGSDIWSNFIPTLCKIMMEEFHQ